MESAIRVLGVAFPEKNSRYADWYIGKILKKGTYEDLTPSEKIKFLEFQGKFTEKYF